MLSPLFSKGVTVATHSNTARQPSPTVGLYWRSRLLALPGIVISFPAACPPVSSITPMPFSSSALATTHPASERQAKHDFSLSTALCRAPLDLACQNVAAQNDPAVSSAGSLFDGWVALKLVRIDVTSSPPPKQKNKGKRLDFLVTPPSEAYSGQRLRGKTGRRNAEFTGNNEGLSLKKPICQSTNKPPGAGKGNPR